MPTFLSVSPQPQAQAASEICKAVLLNISDHLFALPATAILKIVSSSAHHQPQQRLPLWEGHPLILLDLHQLLRNAASDRLSAPAHSSRPNLKRYQVITRTATLDYCAIEVDELPTFQDIALSQVQALSPYHYRLLGSIARHQVTLPYKGVASTVLLLELQHALYRWQIMKSSVS